MATAPQSRSTKPGKPAEETYEEWLTRTCDEAEAESERDGWLTTEQVEEAMARHKYEFYKKQHKAA